MSDPEQWIPRELFAAFCGEDSGPLLSYYDKAREKKKLLVMELDWLALLLLPAWLGLHRRWAMCATLTACICGSLLFEALAHVQIPSGAFAGTGIAFGLMARGLLLTDANGLFLKLKKQNASPAQLAEALTGRGKGSWATALLAVGGCLGVIFLTALSLPGD